MIISKLLAFFGIKRYAKVTHIDGGWYICMPAEANLTLTGDADQCRVDFVWMRESTFNALPEFEGF